MAVLVPKVSLPSRAEWPGAECCEGADRGRRHARRNRGNVATAGGGCTKAPRRVVVYRSLRQMPHWKREELDELGPGLRAFVEASIHARAGAHGTCARCGERFRLPRGPRSRWCPICRPIERERTERERLRRRAKMPAPGRRTCESCGHSYRAARSWSRYCSLACAQKAYRARRQSNQAGAGALLIQEYLIGSVDAG
jgi:hypothetical protein